MVELQIIVSYVAWSLWLSVKAYIYVDEVYVDVIFWGALWVSFKYGNFGWATWTAHVNLKNSPSMLLKLAHRYQSWPIYYKDELVTSYQRNISIYILILQYTKSMTGSLFKREYKR